MCHLVDGQEEMELLLESMEVILQEVQGIFELISGLSDASKILQHFRQHYIMIL